MDDVFVGVFSQHPSGGLRLHDGCAATYTASNGFFSIAEERYTGRKHDDGYRRALGGLLRRSPAIAGGDIHVAFSSALDEIWREADAREQFERETGLRAASVTVFDHHLAHAASALATAPLGSGAVYVVDARGNWADGGYQCESMFSVRMGRLDLEQRAPATERPIQSGWGQLWRAVTKAIGFPSYHDASKTMALAGIARARGLVPLWDPADHGAAYAISRRLVIEDPVTSVIDAVQYISGKRVAPRLDWLNRDNGVLSESVAGLTDNLRLALSMQLSYESWLEYWVGNTAGADQAQRPTLLSGGVAANCVAAGRLVERGYDVRVGAAPGDDGQALGNLMLLLHSFGIDAEAPATAFLGPQVPGGQVPPGFRMADDDRARRLLLQDMPLIAFRGRSEIGPRALGHRSLLSAPTLTAMQRLREVKRREEFQPFGIVVSDSWASDRGIPPSPFMSLASTHPDLPDVARHEDGTVRYQTVDAGSDRKLHELLLWAESCWGTPSLVNTSLNGRGEPLVEHAAQLEASSIAASTRDIWGAIV